MDGEPFRPVEITLLRRLDDERPEAAVHDRRDERMDPRKAVGTHRAEERHAGDARFILEQSPARIRNVGCGCREGSPGLADRIHEVHARELVGQRPESAGGCRTDQAPHKRLSARRARGARYRRIGSGRLTHDAPPSGARSPSSPGRTVGVTIAGVAPRLCRDPERRPCRGFVSGSQ